MLVKRWEKLPLDLQTEAVRPYYEILRKKKGTLIVKRLFDIVLSIILLLILIPLFLALALIIKLDSKGSVFYRQIRVTQYGKQFKIFKFRTMVQNADQIGPLLTNNNDQRITKVGSFLRKYRLDEIPQLLNILTGEMTFVGTRPEVPKYVAHYTDEMKATLLLPAGVTSRASIEYKDEESLLTSKDNVDESYINDVLPVKMGINLIGMTSFNLVTDFIILLSTSLGMFKKSMYEESK